MALSINTNIAALTIQNRLRTSTDSLNRTFERLSSGLRVNSAKDDAAGLGIATSLSAQIRGNNQAARNANDAISLVQVAEGALGETANALQRMRELAVQASNGTLTSTDRSDLNDEFQQLLSEIDRIAENTKFNGQTLLMGSFTAKRLQIGANSGQNLVISLGVAKGTSLGVNGVSLGGNGTMAMSAITQLTTAINSVSDLRSKMGALQNRFEAVVTNLSTAAENLEAARARIMDADIAQETSSLTRNAILQQAGTAVLAQANQQPQLVLALLG
ncbi:MAG: flagellin FliC [Magnetococcales bacterium]|nr:flagellin FliC [Magnetococcales bacterium]